MTKLKHLLWEWLNGRLDLPLEFPRSRVASMGLASNGATTAVVPPTQVPPSNSNSGSMQMIGMHTAHTLLNPDQYIAPYENVNTGPGGVIVGTPGQPGTVYAGPAKTLEFIAAVAAIAPEVGILPAIPEVQRIAAYVPPAVYAASLQGGVSPPAVGVSPPAQGRTQF